MKTIVAIGDSLTYGYPFSPRHSWVSLVSILTGCAMVNKGICGETTGDMLLRFEKDVVALRTDCVIVTGGTNDAFDDTGPEEVAGNIRAMLGLALENGIIPLVGLPPPVDYPYEEGVLQDYRKIMRVLAETHHIGTIDFYEAMLAPDSGGLRQDLHNDGVHPNEAGYRVMAQTVLPVLAAYLKRV